MSFQLVQPSTPEEAVGLLSRSAAGEMAVLGGGTDLLFDLDRSRIAPKKLLSLRKLPWRYFRWEANSLVIGSTLPLSALELDPHLRSRLPGLWEAIRDVGSPALRSRATIGGNLGRCSPVSDLIPILLVLDARVRIVGPTGVREHPVDMVLQESRRTSLGPAELIESVILPASAPSTYVWQRVQPVNDISQVGVAVAFLPEGPHWRIALGGLQPRARRLSEAEAVLRSARPTHFEIELAAQEAARRAEFVSDKRATESYRRRLVTVLVRRAIQTTLERAPLASRPRKAPR
ncbi:MAG TPA: FAD binding domain-containing protein [Thermoplasmata archaeon]|nr:FAD binding domain-containing protein [Thermoplasmata archaeon]